MVKCQRDVRYSNSKYERSSVLGLRLKIPLNATAMLIPVVWHSYDEPVLALEPLAQRGAIPHPNLQCKASGKYIFGYVPLLC
jgi:hypothetical protein